MKFEIKKIYKNILSNLVGECIFVTPRGFPVIKFPDGTEGFYSHSLDSWINYKEPKSGKVYITILQGADGKPLRSLGWNGFTDCSFFPLLAKIEIPWVEGQGVPEGRNDGFK